MRVSARADYALRAAIELAAASDRHVTSEQLARAQNIPGTLLEMILTHLRRSNIVRSKRGPDGGCWLARPASEISLAEIIRAIDGQILSVRGEPPENVTYPGPAEPLRRVWIALRAFGPTVLETVTVADIVSGELWLPGGARLDPGTADRASFLRAMRVAQRGREGCCVSGCRRRSD
jgi:Rrf2 family protein